MWVLDAYSFDYKDIIMPGEIDAGTCKDINDAVGTFSEELDKNQTDRFRQPQKLEMPVQEDGSVSIKTLPNSNNQYSYPGLSYGREEKVFFFISFSIPSSKLKEVILDTLKLKEEKNISIVLALRGFVGNDFKETIKTFYTFKKENDLINTDLPIELNPALFEKYSIDKVPAIIYESTEKTGSISGVGLSYAMEKFSEEIKDYGKSGVTYEISEENIFEVIKARLKSPLYQKRITSVMTKIREKIYRLERYDGLLKETKEEKSYLIEPSITLEKDIVDHNGNVIFEKGSTFNASDYVPLTGRYIFIDGNNEMHVQHAINGGFRKIIIASGNLMELSKKFSHRFYFLDDTLIDRLQLTHVPAILEQDGRHLRVTEKVIN
jgi:conjugal transfer pilus assembly protein TraW